MSNNGEYKPAICDDYKDRKGCGLRIVLKQVEVRGEKKWKQFSKVPVHELDGRFLGFRLVEHYFICPEQTEFKMERMYGIQEEDDKFHAGSKENGGYRSGNRRSEPSFRSRGDSRETRR